MPRRSDRIKSLAAVSQFRIGALWVRPDSLTIVRDEEEIALEPRMMEVLVTLAEHAGEVVSVEQLLIEVWRGSFYGDSPVHKTIAVLRQRIGDNRRAPVFIETVRKRGYRLIAKVVFPDDYRGGPRQLERWLQGSPYVGLQAFDSAHAAVFHGRSRAAAELLSALRSQIDSQRRFVLVSGASGCGKTSLLRAGTIPLLQQAGGLNGMQALSTTCCDLSACRGGDVLPQLAAALCEWTLDARQIFLPAQNAELVRKLRDSPGLLRASIDEAFERAASRRLSEQAHAHLLLVIDHAEAVVATPGMTEEDRLGLAAALVALCATPRVAVVMLTRSDFYPRLIEALPAIAELKAGDGHIDLLSPRVGEIAQIIRTPAALAGLSFEEDGDSLARLDDVLRDAAAQQPEALPLLQLALQALYERQDEGGVLTFRAYRELGGLEGALANRAEQAFVSLPDESQACLEQVLARLTVVHSGSEALTARRVAWSAIESDAARALIESFVRARLFVSELAGGEPTFGVAHEALLRQWPRAREWARENRRLLQARERLQIAARRWVEEGRRPDRLLNAGRPLSEAQEVARRLPADLGEDDQAFLATSERMYDRRRRLRLALVGGLALLTATSLVLGVQAHRARRDAERHRDQAQQLVSFMLGDLADNLRPLGNLTLLNSVGTQALGYLERLPAADLQPQELINHARALRTVGEVLMNQGKFDAARSAFVASSAAAQRALSTAPDSLEALAETGTCAYWLGYYHYRQERLAQARTHWLDYLRASERLLAREPGNPTWRLELSYALNNLGSIATNQHRFDEAIALFERSVALKGEVLAQRPGDASLQTDLVDSLSWLSSAQESQGELASAAMNYQRHVRTLRSLVAAAPDNDAWRHRLATSLLRSSILALARGESAIATTTAAESQALLLALSRRHPDNRIWRRDLAHAYAQVGLIASFSGSRDAAFASYRRARDVLKPLLEAKSGALPEWQWVDAVVQLRLAQLESRRDRSLAQTDTAIRLMERLRASAPDERLGLVMLAHAYLWRGEQLAQAGRAEPARNDWERARALLAPSAAQSKDKDVLDPWIRLQVLLGHADTVKQQTGWLKKAGYRHPGFVAYYDQPTTRETTP